MHWAKFYLAFENSVCDDYITEKVWCFPIFNLQIDIFSVPLHPCQLQHRACGTRSTKSRLWKSTKSWSSFQIRAHTHMHTFHKIGFSSKIVHSHGWLSFPKGSSSGIHFIHLSSFCLDFTNFGWVGSEFWAGWFRTCSDFCCGFLFLKQCVASICSTSTLTQKIILDTWNGKAISK